jgi:hypothetical protein
VITTGDRFLFPLSGGEYRHVEVVAADWDDASGTTAYSLAPVGSHPRYGRWIADAAEIRERAVFLPRPDMDLGEPVFRVLKWTVEPPFAGIPVPQTAEWEAVAEPTREVYRRVALAVVAVLLTRGWGPPPGDAR